MLSHKWKRSLQDIPVDLTKVQEAKEKLKVLQEQISGIDETSDEMRQIMRHFDVLQGLLSTAKETKISFSSVSEDDLSDFGVERRLLSINEDVLAHRLENSARGSDKATLCTNPSNLPFCLHAIAEISADGEAKLPVAIFPQMQIDTGIHRDGVSITSPTTNSQVRLTGNVDYGICTYTLGQSRVLNASIYDIIRLTDNCITLVQGEQYFQMSDSIPEAVSQAIALSEVTEKEAVRYCLTDGKTWGFSVLTKNEQGNWVNYDGPWFKILEPRQDSPVDSQEEFQHSVHTVVELMYHWLVASDDPLSDPLYTL